MFCRPSSFTEYFGQPSMALVIAVGQLLEGKP